MKPPCKFRPGPALKWKDINSIQVHQNKSLLGFFPRKKKERKKPSPLLNRTSLTKYGWEKLQSRIEASSQMNSSVNPGLHFNIPQKHLRLLFHTDREQVDEGDVLSRDIDPNKYLASTVLCCLRWGYYGPWQVLFIGCWRAKGKKTPPLFSVPAWWVFFFLRTGDERCCRIFRNGITASS